jgi:hypothetical protein
MRTGREGHPFKQEGGKGGREGGKKGGHEGGAYTLYIADPGGPGFRKEAGLDIQDGGRGGDGTKGEGWESLASPRREG